MAFCFTVNGNRKQFYYSEIIDKLRAGGFQMTYCTSCGKALDEGARFCSGCGTTVSGQSTSFSGVVVSPPSVTRVVVVKPKRGGLLALKGLLAAIILAVIFGIATRSDNTAHAFSMVIAFGMGAAYIISNLRLWKRNSDIVEGASIGWVVAVFLLLGCLGGLMNVGSSGSSGSASSASSGTPTPSSINAKAYVLPADFFLNPVAEREPQGEIYISGTTNLPDGMQMWVVLGRKGTEEKTFISEGSFRSGPHYEKGTIPITGTQPVEFTAEFNPAWQNKTVLSLVGEGGKNLHGRLFKLKDPDVTDSEKILEATFTLSLPPISPEANAINIVKHAVLTVPGSGKSATDIEENLALYAKAGCKPINGWSASRTGTNVYNVSYDFDNGGGGEQQAIWSVNIVTKQVKYLNRYAKGFSWTPNY